MRSTPPMRSKRRDPWAAKLGFTDKEWVTFQSRLTHATKAIDMLRERAPEVFERLYGQLAINPKTAELTPDAKNWMNHIVADLLITQHRRRHHRQVNVHTSHRPQRAALKLVGRKKR